MADKINPDHYKGNKSGIQAIDIIEIFDLNFSRGNAVKYILRAGRKGEQGYDALNKEIEDLEKAKWYISRELDRLKTMKIEATESILDTPKPNKNKSAKGAHYEIG